jgi:hypothetical protein
MGYPESFARHYDEWSARMTEDVAFYVGLAREADGLLVELAIGDCRVAIRCAGDGSAGHRNRLSSSASHDVESAHSAALRPWQQRR